jgi:zinc/manganese transport system permease protein
MANTFTTLTDAWQYDFVRSALEAGTVCALLAAAVGYFVVLRQMAFAGHALGHIGFAGACAGVVLGWGALPGMLALNILAAAGMGLLGRRMQESDLIIGMTLAVALGLGTFFLAMFKGYAGEATVILFGNILSVSPGQTLGMAVLTAVSLAGLLVLFRPLLFATLEPELAAAKGVPLRLVSTLFYVLVAVAVAFASQIVGVLLVFTLLIGPPAIAMRFCRTVWPGLLLSIALGVGTTWVSLILAYLSDAPVSFWVPTLLFVLYLGSSLVTRRKRHA